jgi:deoxyribodipyrimidine photolyase-related protein
VSADVALVLGDQLSLDNPALARVDRTGATVLMIEAPGEAGHVWSHKARIALFLSAMRHFAAALRAAGWTVRYVELDEPGPASLSGRLEAQLRALGARSLVACEAGEWRVQRDVQDACARAGVAGTWVSDPHFLLSRAEFSRWVGERRELRMEHFYRWMRARTGVLMEDGQPAGGRWNFDADNRRGFGRAGPLDLPRPVNHAPDGITREVLELVGSRFRDHPGSLEHFAWPVTRAQALASLRDFIEHRLPGFGTHQDAMWEGEPHLWHSLLSTSLNLKLLHPREVIDAAVRAWRERSLELAGVEGFVRQVLGWREFIRGVYWHFMPGLASENHFGHHRPLPAWYWTGETRMACLRAAIGQTLEHGYAHHIQRLMVTGNFALLAELSPQAVADWYLAVYVDAVEWVELPNTAGMALYANGGRFTSKPYAASGAYIDRMSNHCRGCRYRPGQRTGPQACPVTTLFWNFLDRHETAFARNPRTALMAGNVARLPAAERAAIRAEARRMLDGIDAL